LDASVPAEQTEYREGLLVKIESHPDRDAYQMAWCEAVPLRLGVTPEIIVMLLEMS